MRVFLVPLLFVGALLSLPAQAAPKAKEAHLCKMSFVSVDKFVQKELAFWILQDGSVQVFDLLIKHHVGKPVLADVLQDDSSRLKFRWQVGGLEGRRIKSLGPTRYTATYRKASGVVTVAVVLSGADNRPSGKGKCEPIKKR